MGLIVPLWTWTFENVCVCVPLGAGFLTTSYHWEKNGTKGRLCVGTAHDRLIRYPSLLSPLFRLISRKTNKWKECVIIMSHHLSCCLLWRWQMTILMISPSSRPLCEPSGSALTHDPCLNDSVVTPTMHLQRLKIQTDSLLKDQCVTFSSVSVC